MDAAAIRKKYPAGDRFALWINCCKRKQTPAEFLRELPPQLKFEDEFDKPHQQ